MPYFFNWIVPNAFKMTPTMCRSSLFQWVQSQNTFWLSKISTNLSYMQSFREIGLKLWKIGAIQNRYPIVVYCVMSDSESKNPRPMTFRYFPDPCTSQWTSPSKAILFWPSNPTMYCTQWHSTFGRWFYILLRKQSLPTIIIMTLSTFISKFGVFWKIIIMSFLVYESMNLPIKKCSSKTSLSLEIRNLWKY